MLNKQNDRLPLTSAQIGIWFEQQLALDNPIYKAVEYIDIRGPIDVTLLEVTLHQVLSETEAARVRIEVDDEGVWQLIDRSVDWRLPVLDLRNAADPWTRAQDWMRADLSRVIDLQQGPVFSVTVLQLADDHFLLVLSPGFS
jgi:Condensation domain